MRRYTPAFGVLPFAAILAGCAVGPYQRPQVAPPPTFRQLQEPTSASLADQAWSEVFKDPVLQQLVRDAIRNNYDLRIAAVRVEEARATARIDASGLYPQISVAGSIAREQVPPYGIINAASVAPQLSWEIDFWGRLRKERDAGRYQLLASEEGRRGVLVSLIAQVASGYFTLRELDLQLQIARDTVGTRQHTLDLFNKLKLAGVNSGLDIAQAEADLAAAESSIPDLERQIVQQEDSLRLLLAENPGEITRGTLLTDQYMPPGVPAGLPSALLERRPDIREAEASLQSFYALIGVARGNFFPQISLTGLLGIASSQLTGLAGGSGLAYSGGASLLAPVFEGGRLRGQYDLARQQFEENKATYEKSVQNSFREVADALIQTQKLRELRVVQERQVDALSRALHLSTIRYTGGLSSYLDVLDSQRGLFSAQIALAQTRGGQLLALVDLYRALGGGWQQP
jgi:outer membrane protein, multidrug efflux system